MKFIKWIASAIGIGSRAFVALVGVAGITAAVANYAMTQGSGTNFGSLVVSTVHYAQQLICDPTTPANCGGVTASNEQKVLDAQVLAAVQAAIPPQSPAVPIGGTGICDGANGTTNPCTNAATVKAASTPAAASDKALVVDQRPGTTILAGVDPSSGKGTPSSVPISISTATTTQLVAASGSTVIYITAWDVIAAGTGNITLQSADTGGACANPVALTGAYNLTAQAGIAKGDGAAMVLKTPSGKALCALTSAAVQMSGSVTYQQF